MKLTPHDIAKMLDHSTLQRFLTDDDIRKGCELALHYDTASVCARPCDMPLVTSLLKGSDVKVCTVIGFPNGYSSTEVKACEVKPGATYRAILAPQQAALTVTVTTDDGRSHTKTLSSAQLESGRRYDMSVLVTNEEIQISLSGDIGDWEDGGSLDGSGGGDDGDDSQTLSYGGVTYRTRTVGETVWMAENLRYVPDEALLTKGIWYPDGNEDAEYVREHGMLYSFTVALGGAQVVSGAPVRGICPERWHVPYIDELQTLAAGPDCGFTLAGMWNSVSKNYVSSAKSGYLMSATTDDGGSSYSALLFYASGGNPSPSSLPAGNGVSLRCVKDAK